MIANLSIVFATKQTLSNTKLLAFLPSYLSCISFSLFSIDLGPKYLPLEKYVKDMERNKFKVLKEH